MSAMLRVIAVAGAIASGAALPAAVPIIIFVPGKTVDVKPIRDGTRAVVITHDIFQSPVYLATDTVVADPRSPVAADPAAIVRVFTHLCLASGFDQAKFDTAAAASPLGFKRVEITLRSQRRGQPDAVITDWQTPFARAVLWREAPKAALSGRPQILIMRKGTLGREYRDDSVGPQCNVFFTVTGLRTPDALISGINAAAGVNARKLVTKSTWADGDWDLAPADGLQRRVVYSALRLEEDIQIVHLALLAKITKFKNW